MLADALQYELDEGPCLTAFPFTGGPRQATSRGADAWAERRVVRMDEIDTDPRWSRWSQAVRPLGLRSALSAPLVAGDQGLGAMKVYATTPGAYDAHDAHLLSMFAAQAAVMLANVQSYETAQRLSESLRAALRSRDLIGQAKGVLMAQEGIDEDAAFALLTAASQRENIKVHDVARALVESASKRRP